LTIRRRHGFAFARPDRSFPVPLGMSKKTTTKSIAAPSGGERH